MSDDRAIEVMAEHVSFEKPGGWTVATAYSDTIMSLNEARDFARDLVEALASAGFQITDLTPEDGATCVAALETWGQVLSTDEQVTLAKLRRLSEANGG